MQEQNTLQPDTPQRSMLDPAQLGKPRPSDAQVELQPVIDKIYNEAKAEIYKRNTDEVWDNLKALGDAMGAIDVDSYDQRIRRDSEVIEKTRLAKLRSIEMLYELAKQMPKRGLMSFIFYLTMVMREVAERLLSKWMGGEYWAEFQPGHQRWLVALDEQMRYIDDDEAEDDYEIEEDLLYKDETHEEDDGGYYKEEESHQEESHEEESREEESHEEESYEEEDDDDDDNDDRWDGNWGYWDPGEEGGLGGNDRMDEIMKE